MALIDIQIAARNLAQHRKRTLFLGGATALVTALLLGLLALTDGVEHTIVKSGSTMMTGHVNVGGFYKVTAGSAAPLVLDYEKVLSLVKPQVPELSYAVGRGRGYAKAISPTSSMDLVLGGLELERDPGFREVMSIAEGDLEDLSRPGTLLLFQSEARKLGVRVGDSVTLSAPTYRGMANTAEVRVAAIARNMGVLSYFNAFVPAESLRSLYTLRPGSTGAIHLYLEDYRAATEVAERLRALLARSGYRMMDADPRPFYLKLLLTVNKEEWTGQKIDVTTWADELSMMKDILSLVRLISGGILATLLFIVGLGVVSTMGIAVRERTREIGTLRAIGMHRRRVLAMFLTEAFLLGLGGSAVGAVLGCAAIAIVDAARIGVPEAMQWIIMSDHVVLPLHPAKVAASVVGLTLLTALAALPPCLRAARLRPVTAMQHHGG